jgi:hypothetical protein
LKTEARVLDQEDLTLIDGAPFDGERIRMSFDENSMAHLASMFIDMYSDIELAVLRELSTNARDEHVRYGVKRPIEITLPTKEDPNLRIRDYGKGLDAESIRDLYSKYGASDKRDSNDVVGMLGIGCKSPLAYTDKYTITAIKDGIQTYVTIIRDEDDGGSMVIEHQFETSKPSGVEIVIPVKSDNRFHFKAKQFFRFWETGVVLVDGKQPTPLGYSLQLTDNIFMSDELDKSYVVMGNVPYPMPDGYEFKFGDFNNHHYIVAYINIGDVLFAPSREALMMKPKTVAKLDEIAQIVPERQKIVAQQLINEADTFADALYTKVAMNKMGIFGVYSYGGHRIPASIKKPKDSTWVKVATNKEKKTKEFDHTDEVEDDMLEKTVWIVGYDSDRFTISKRNKLMLWKENRIPVKRVTNYIFTWRLPEGSWISPENVFPWQEIKDTKLPRKNSYSRRNGGIVRQVSGGTYEAYTAGMVYNSTLDAEKIDTSNPIFFINQNDFKQAHIRALDYLLPDGYTLIRFGENRKKKFLRDFPQAAPVVKSIEKLVKLYVKTLSEYDKIVLVNHDEGSDEGLSELDFTRIKDKKLRKAVWLMTRKSNADLLVAKESLGFYLMNQITLKTQWENPLESGDYPLWDVYGKLNDTTKEHGYLYFNAVHASKKKGKKNAS